LDLFQLGRLLRLLGFRIVRRRGSHYVLKHEDGRVTVVPVHAGEKIGRGLLLKIAKDAKLSKEQFVKMLNEA